MNLVGIDHLNKAKGAMRNCGLCLNQISEATDVGEVECAWENLLGQFHRARKFTLQFIDRHDGYSHERKRIEESAEIAFMHHARNALDYGLRKITEQMPKEIVIGPGNGAGDIVLGASGQINMDRCVVTGGDVQPAFIETLVFQKGMQFPKLNASENTRIDITEQFSLCDVVDREVDYIVPKNHAGEPYRPEELASHCLRVLRSALIRIAPELLTD
ncbi:MAG: hypothetical protein RIE24_24305 [Silicimonas sp.]